MAHIKEKFHINRTIYTIDSTGTVRMSGCCVGEAATLPEAASWPTPTPASVSAMS